jgi:hypothetical protein
VTGPTPSHDVGQAPASSDAEARLEQTLARIRADVRDPSWSPAAEDLDELADRLESAWSAWRQHLGRVGEPGEAP